MNARSTKYSLTVIICCEMAEASYSRNVVDSGYADHTIEWVFQVITSFLES